MTLPASGAISMADINTELGYASTAAISLNDAAVRTLAGKASGAIAMIDFYGKSAGETAGSQLYTSGVNTFTVPAGITNICVACGSIGLAGATGEAANYDGFGSPGAGGAGGDGGSLAYRNNITVTPGQQFIVSLASGYPSFDAGGTLGTALSVSAGRAGFTGTWTASYLGGQGGAGSPHNGAGSIGHAGGGGGAAATWAGAGIDGAAAPGAASVGQPGSIVDIYGVVVSSTGGAAGDRSVSAAGVAATGYGAGGGGGSGQDTTFGGAPGFGPYAGGAEFGTAGFCRIIWGTGKNFPSNANF